MMGPSQKKKIEKRMRVMTRVNTAIGVVGILAVVLLFLWMRFYIDADLLHHDDSHDDEHTEETHETDDSHEEEYDDHGEEVTTTLSEEDMSELEHSYEQTINEELSGHDFSDPQASQERLDSVLEMKVPSTYQELHLSLVIALNSSVNGNIEQAQQQIDELKTTYSWFLSE